MDTISKSSRNTLFLLGIVLSITIFQTKNLSAENKISPPHVEAKIINGEQSKSNTWPWMAAISTTTDTQELVINRQFCGGTLVAPQWVLTAAHCAEGFPDSNLEVLLGQNNLDGTGGETIPVTHFVIHPDHNSETNYADLALLHLKTPSSIQPVSTGSFDFQSERRNPATSLGWGTTKQNLLLDDYPTDLHQVQLTMDDNSICHHPSVPDNALCLSILDKKSPCHGDSGGPLLMFDSHNQNWKQIGIITGGITEECTQQGAAEIYTQVDTYKQFIDLTITASPVSSKEFLIKCATKYPKYAGQIKGSAFSCADGSTTCLDTTGGSLMNVSQISIPDDNPNEVLEYAVDGKKHKATYSELGYCN